MSDPSASHRSSDSFLGRARRFVPLRNLWRTGNLLGEDRDEFGGEMLMLERWMKAKGEGGMFPRLGWQNLEGVDELEISGCEELRSSSVRLLDEQQTMLGVLSMDEAVRMADDADLILAILSKDADPPVLRIFESTDYKKRKYEQQKKKGMQQKRSAANRMDIKELKNGLLVDFIDR
ncbi:Translation initiation factor IF-3, N-terminal domain [Musa troglodytarum]|uniref:Translation initiation factor IF-3, N-terminal domain n=1 Tax=Musa troglodytarum TaxID=320322 RepID=A0A9E7GB37_9LILI|nr:Translation initiation factor IF-3, N-terminal domain [Musa troglodytarum]